MHMVIGAEKYFFWKKVQKSPPGVGGDFFAKKHRPTPHINLKNIPKMKNQGRGW